MGGDEPEPGAGPIGAGDGPHDRLEPAVASRGLRGRVDVPAVDADDEREIGPRQIEVPASVFDDAASLRAELAVEALSDVT